MTVIEREIAETAIVTYEREQRAGALEAAALEIEVRGWAQGAPYDDAGHVCLLGAINLASGHERYDWLGSMELWHPNWRDHLPGGHQMDLLPLARWNDEDERTADEVTFLLRWRAEEIRDGR